MNGRAQQSAEPITRAKSSRALFVVLALLALFSQLLVPVARVAAMPLALDGVVADLRATFGDSVVVCAQVDEGTQTPGHPFPGCDENCPLCSLTAAAVVLPPAAPDLPPPVSGREYLPPPPVAHLASGPPLRSPAQPRAPPFEA